VCLLRARYEHATRGEQTRIARQRLLGTSHQIGTVLEPEPVERSAGGGRDPHHRARARRQGTLPRRLQALVQRRRKGGLEAGVEQILDRRRHGSVAVPEPVENAMQVRLIARQLSHHHREGARPSGRALARAAQDFERQGVQRHDRDPRDRTTGTRHHALGHVIPQTTRRDHDPHRPRQQSRICPCLVGEALDLGEQRLLGHPCAARDEDPRPALPLSSIPHEG
jgi:hypothetical protein